MSRYNSYYPGNMQGMMGRTPTRRQRQSSCMTRSEAPAAPPSACACPDSTSCTADSSSAAMAFINRQLWQNTYDNETALCRGTIFPCLDLPFLAYRGASI